MKAKWFCSEKHSKIDPEVQKVSEIEEILKINKLIKAE